MTRAAAADLDAADVDDGVVGLHLARDELEGLVTRMTS